MKNKWLVARPTDADWEVRFTVISWDEPGVPVYALFGEPIFDEMDRGYYGEPRIVATFENLEEAEDARRQHPEFREATLHIRRTVLLDRDPQSRYANRSARLLLPSLEIEVMRGFEPWTLEDGRPLHEVPAAVSMLYVGDMKQAIDGSAGYWPDHFPFLRVDGPEIPFVEDEFDTRLKEFELRIKDWRKTPSL